NSSQWDEIVKLGYHSSNEVATDLDNKEKTIQAMNDTISSKNQQIAQIQGANTTLTTQVTNLTTQYNIAQEQALKVPQLIQERDQAIHDNKLSQEAEDAQQQKIK